jgi:flagellar biosynthesis protein FliR
MTIGVHEFWSFLLIFARVTALFVTAPVFGNHSVPKQVKIGLAALITFALLPLVSPKVVGAPADVFTLVGQLAAETGVGLCLGFLVQLIFSSLEVAGHYVDTQMGFGIINVLNPVSEQHTSAMGQFLYQMGMVLFLILGGHLFLIGTLAGSFNAVGPGGAHFSGDMTGAFTGVVGQMFLTAFKIAAPAAAVLMVVDVAFGIIARTVPQINILIVGMPIKVIVGLTTMAVVLPAMAMVVAQMVPVLGAGAQALLQAAR